MNQPSNSQKQPSQIALEASAMKLIKDKILPEGGKMPSMEAIQLAARMMVAKAVRECKKS